MVFESFFNQEIETPKENAAGEYRLCCPFSEETKYKFNLKRSTDSDNGLKQCKSCGESANLITLMKSHYRGTFKQAVELLETKNIDIQKPLTLVIYMCDLSDSESVVLRLNGHKKDNKRIKSTAPGLDQGFQLVEDTSDIRKRLPYLRYLKNRGITLQQILDYSIGYIINGYCYSYGINNEKKKIVLRNSVIFFTYDNEGKYIYWNTRSIETNPYIKSINAPSKPNEYGKSDVIFNLNIASRQKFVVITEGVFDALTFDKYGIATFGKQVSKIQVNNLISSIPKETPIYIMLSKHGADFRIKLARTLIMRYDVVNLQPRFNEGARAVGMQKSFRHFQIAILRVTPQSIANHKGPHKLHAGNLAL
ncbi:primase [Staphylococcus phage vB_SauH_DELF3]|nr:primase [Staphylococcus phage vB_SauH_DELF3]